MDFTLILWAIAVLLMAAAFLGLLVPNVPGPALLFAGMLLAAWAEDFRHIGFGVLVVLGTVAALAMVIDLGASAWSARRYGSSGWAVAGAALGAIVGLFFGLVGVLLGPFLGAAAGEFLVHRNVETAGRAGLGASIGIILGTAAKAALMFGMLGFFLLVRVL